MQMGFSLILKETLTIVEHIFITITLLFLMVHASQTITGSTTFYNLTKSTSNTVNVNSNIQISNNLRVENGTLADNGNTIKVLKDVYNAGTITYGGGVNSATQLGLHLNGTISQSVEGTGTFGKLTIDNPRWSISSFRDQYTTSRMLFD